MNKIETDSENRLVFVKGEEGLGGKGWEFGIRHKLLLIYMGWLNNQVPLYSTGNYIQYPVIKHHGKEFF